MPLKTRAHTSTLAQTTSYSSTNSMPSLIQTSNPVSVAYYAEMIKLVTNTTQWRTLAIRLCPWCEFCVWQYSLFLLSISHQLTACISYFLICVFSAWRYWHNKTFCRCWHFICTWSGFGTTEECRQCKSRLLWHLDMKNRKTLNICGFYNILDIYQTKY